MLRFNDNTARLVELKAAGAKDGARWRVKDVDLSVSAGEIATLIGPNGSGKSTTIKLALGLLKADAGDAWQKPGLTVGYVPQELSIDSSLPLTVDRFMRLTGSVDKASQAEALALTDTAHLSSRQLNNLSGGQLQRVLVARALAKSPDLLVLDEPAQNLDVAGEIEIYQLIQNARDELGCGVLLISHDLHVVMAASDKVLCLNGHLCCSGSPVSVARSPEFLELYGASQSEALALYTHQHDHDHHEGHHHAR